MEACTEYKSQLFIISNILLAFSELADAYNVWW